MSHDRLLKLASRLFRFGALMCLFASTLWLTFGSPATLKQAGRDSHIYDAAAKIAQDSAINANIDPSVKVGLENAAATTFTPQYLQSVSEQFMDGTYHWLEGKSDKPDFHVDATTVVNQFFGKVADTTVANATKLPPCGAGQVTDLNGLDLENLKCLPPGITPAVIRDETIKRLKGTNNLLSNPVLTADSVSNVTGKADDGNPATPAKDVTQPASEPFYQQLSPLPMYYRIASFMPWIFGLIALIAALWIFQLYHDNRKAIYRICRGLLWVGLPIFIATLIGHFIFRSAANSGSLAHAVDGNLQQYGIAFARSMEGAFAHRLLWISGTMAAIGGIVTIIFFNSARRQDHNINVDHDSTKGPTTTAASPSTTEVAPDSAIHPVASATSPAPAAGDTVTPGGINPSPLLDTKPLTLNNQIEDYPNLAPQDRPKFQATTQPASSQPQDTLPVATPAPQTIAPAPQPTVSEQGNVINVSTSDGSSSPAQTI